MLNVIDPIDTPDSRFHDGNPATGELGTIVIAAWLNAVQEAVRTNQKELIAILAAGGIEVDPDDDAQLLAAIRQLSGADITAHVNAANPHQQYAPKVHTHATADIDGLDARLSAIRMYKPGQMVAMFCSVPPDGTLVCNGGEIARVLYPDLYATIGIAFGAGDGSTTFNLPNLADGLALLAGGSVGTITTGSVISHSHTGMTGANGDHAHSWPYVPMVGTTGGSGSYSTGGGTLQWTNTIGNHSHALSINNTGGSQNLAAGMRLLICIAY